VRHKSTKTQSLQLFIFISKNFEKLSLLAKRSVAPAQREGWCKGRGAIMDDAASQSVCCARGGCGKDGAKRCGACKQVGVQASHVHTFSE
jgi:hypothetical protein